MRSRTACRSTGGPAMTGRHRSGIAAKRAGALLMVKSPGLTPSSTSSQVNGVETPPNSLARGEYAVASVLPRMFCR